MPPMENNEELSKALKKAADIIKDAEAILVTAGAGLGVDAGLHIYRTEQDFLDAHPEVRELGLSLPDMSNIDLFRKHPRLAWGFYGKRWQLYNEKEPHYGYDILKRWCESSLHGYYVFTSNVDGHFIRAGFDPHRVVEAHGSVNHLQCVDSYRHKEVWRVPDGFQINIDDKLSAKEPLPRGPPGSPYPSLARPGLIFYHDDGWIDEPFKQTERSMDEFIETIKEQKIPTAIIEIGAGDTDPRIRVRGLGESLAAGRNHVKLIRINPGDRDVIVPEPNKNVSVRWGALAALTRIDKLSKGEMYY